MPKKTKYNQTNSDNTKDVTPYHKNVIEFVTVAREYCVLIENVNKYSRYDFVKVTAQILPLLYLKTALLPHFEPMLEDDLMDGLDEFAYEERRKALRSKLGNIDDYLEVFREDMRLSETPVIANISEDLADIYQDLYNFCSSYRDGINEIMNDAICRVVENFQTYCGQRLCNAQRALHNALYCEDLNEDEQEKN